MPSGFYYNNKKNAENQEFGVSYIKIWHLGLTVQFSILKSYNETIG